MGQMSQLCMQIDELDAAGYSYQEIADIVGWNSVDVGNYLVDRENQNYNEFIEEDYGFSGDIEDFQA